MLPKIQTFFNIPAWGTFTPSDSLTKYVTKTCASEGDMNQWLSRFCGGSGARLDTSSRNQHQTPSPDLEQAVQREYRQASQQMGARHWGRDKGTRYQLDRSSKISPEPSALARCYRWPMLIKRLWTGFGPIVSKNGKKPPEISSACIHILSICNTIVFFSILFFFQTVESECIFASAMSR
jgi:hypothetical protein